ncbi:GDP-L-fucose synthase [compost metagenome]
MESDLLINDVANIGNGSIVTILELAQAVIQLTNSQSKIAYLPPLEEGDMTRRQPDVSKMNELLGRPFMSLEDGIGIILNNLR